MDRNDWILALFALASFFAGNWGGRHVPTSFIWCLCWALVVRLLGDFLRWCAAGAGGRNGKEDTFRRILMHNAWAVYYAALGGSLVMLGYEFLNPIWKFYLTAAEEVEAPKVEYWLMLVMMLKEIRM